jgi:hypothetical protein
MEVTPLMVSISQACAIIGRGTAAMYELIGAGKIKAKKSDGRTLVIYESLVAYMKELPDAKIAPPRRRKFEQIKTTPPRKRKPQHLRQAEAATS